MQVSEATFVIVDVETTGLSPQACRVIEIGAIKVRGDVIEDTFHSLIDPECPLPYRIQQLTGIQQADLDSAPTACEVIPAFVTFLSDGIFVAHNVSFDWRFINSELRRLMLPALTNPKLCTVRLARRLLRQLPSKSLGALTKFYGFEVAARHRALSDADAARMVLLRLMKRLDSIYNICTLMSSSAFKTSRINI